MAFKINTKKRIQILKTQLLKIKRENQTHDDELWFSVFIRNFEIECGLSKTSIRSRSRDRRLNGAGTNDIYFFKVVDKYKYMLAKIKYGI